MTFIYEGVEVKNLMLFVNGLRKLFPVEETGCVIWPRTKNNWGYGRISCYRLTGSKVVSFLAHRISFEQHVGEILEDLNVLHSCDIPDCIAPWHLWSGTLSDNRQDAVHKGRVPTKYTRRKQKCG